MKMKDELALEEEIIARSSKSMGTCTTAAEMSLQHPDVQAVVGEMEADDPHRLAIEKAVNSAAFVVAMAMKKYWRQKGVEEGSNLIFPEVPKDPEAYRTEGIGAFLKEKETDFGGALTIGMIRKAAKEIRPYPKPRPWYKRWLRS
jgi:hypothetical protein